MRYIEFKIYDWNPDRSIGAISHAYLIGTETTETDMTPEDVAKAIKVYDKFRLRRSGPHRARWADDAESLLNAFKNGRISKSTYYRRLKLLPETL